MSQQNLPTLQYSNGPVNLPAEVMASMVAMYDEAFSGFGTLASRRIKAAKMGFELIDGGNKETIPFDQLFGVFVGSAPMNHAVWYEKDYTPGQEPEEPDLVWLMPTPDTFPDALPHQFRVKVLRNGAERWAFQILRRTLFILLRNIGGSMTLDLDRPYVMDLSSMSLFGKSMPEQNMYKWGAIRDVCSQYSTPHMQVLPSMFLTKIVADANTSVTGPVMFMPMRDQNTGQLQFLDGSLIMAIHDVAQRQSTRDMLTIHEKLTYKSNKTGGVQTAQQPPLQMPPMGQMVDPSLVQQQQIPPGMAYPQQVAPPVQQSPTQVVAPQPVPPSTAVPSNLLAQAQQILSQGGSQIQPPAMQQPVQPVIQAPAQQPPAMQQPAQPVIQPPAMQPQAPVQDASVQSSINNLMAQLG